MPLYHLARGLGACGRTDVSGCVGRLIAPTQERLSRGPGLVVVAGDYASVQKALRRIVPLGLWADGPGSDPTHRKASFLATNVVGGPQPAINLKLAQALYARYGRSVPADSREVDQTIRSWVSTARSNKGP